MKEKRNFKEEIKEFWKEEGPKIKIGIKCFSLGLLIGFVKGVLTESKISSETTLYKLIDKLPNESDEDDNEI